jgi:FdhD protein
VSGHQRVEQFLVRRVDAAAIRRAPDDVIVEEPLAIHLDGTLVATTMRTPGHDFELAVGFCHTEGLLAGAPVTACRYCGPNGRAVDSDFNTVDVHTGGVAPAPRPRLGTVSSSCGLCGSEALDELTDRLEPFVDPATIDPSVLVTVPDLVRPHQELFARTGGVHAAALFDGTGAIRLVREDIGRHNAVDKVVGRLLLDGDLPGRHPVPDALGLFVSGRASLEMVQKCWAAGIPTLVSVSAPSSLAVAAARLGNLTLAGFVRDGRATLYAP